MNSFLEQDYDLIKNSECIDWEKLENTSFLITGATGLVGSMVVKSLLKCHKNITVYAFVRSLEKAKSIFKEEIDNSQLKFVVGDITDSFEIENKIDYIIHGASVTASKYMVSNPVETLMIAIKGTTNVLEFAKAKNVRSMVYISSMEVFGITDPKKNLINEKDLGYIDILNPRSSYSEGKRICECICAAYFSQYGIPVKIARLAQTFGAGVPDSDTRVFAQFAKSAINGEDIVLHTKGESVGNYCYTADVVTALLCLLTRGESSEAYTVVNEETTMCIKDMAQLVATEISGGRSQVVFNIPESSASLGYAPDVTMHLSSEKLRNLGWKPTYGLRELYERMISDWQKKVL